ncbi:unnamed protein product [Pseudo-nitzschia multistriata]|uniref:SET domain-containing protein n=1 Tax=Pseudo-nitzschia multistriata TaxID=183589 RepID=A0A448ZKG4_9STRA|nr:unnamed protein product [Pseudo-nitzschia multistriata]
MDDEDEEDPFDVFGDDDSDSDNDNDAEQVVTSKESMEFARSLVDATNEKISHPKSESGRSTAIVSTPVSSSERNDNNDCQDRQLEDLSYLKAWENKWPDPMYKGEILLVSPLPVGGGRGYVATTPIAPGTLVLVESPMMTWPDEQIGKKLGMVSVKHLIEHPNASKIVDDLEDFYPTKEQVDRYNGNEDGTMEIGSDEYEQIPKMIQFLKSELASSAKGEESGEPNSKEKDQELLDLVELSKTLHIRSRDNTELTEIDIIRLLLVLRYNGLESGVYRHVAMLNHDDYPNCAKFLPTGGKTFSEVRTTRRVQPGESLTISYLPRVVSHASRRKVLWEQHRFDIGVKHLKGERYKMETIASSLPPSPIQGVADETLTDRIELATEELEKMQAEIEASLHLTSAATSAQTFETVKALEQTALELYKEAGEQLQNLNHILLIPILILHMDICALVLRDSSLSNSVQLGVISRQVVSAYHLLPLQKLLLGADHFDIARTTLDLADSVSQLLSRSAKTLYNLNFPSMDSFAAWSTFEHETRKEHNRIKALYPHDVEKHINV